MSPEAQAWQQGFLAGYFMDRGYSVKESLSRAQQVPDHLTEDVIEWNPYR